MTDSAAGASHQMTLHRTRSRKYPQLENGVTMGTVCEYERDGWTWVVVTDLQAKPGREYENLDFDTDEPLVRFLILDELTDSEFRLFEGCESCYEYVKTARRFKDHDGAGRFTPRSKFLEKFKPLGPLHPSRSEENRDD